MELFTNGINCIWTSVNSGQELPQYIAEYHKYRSKTFSKCLVKGEKVWSASLQVLRLKSNKAHKYLVQYADEVDRNLHVPETGRFWDWKKGARNHQNKCGTFHGEGICSIHVRNQLSSTIGLRSNLFGRSGCPLRLPRIFFLLKSARLLTRRIRSISHWLEASTTAPPPVPFPAGLSAAAVSVAPRTSVFAETALPYTAS